jgi:hypothetical protein
VIGPLFIVGSPRSGTTLLRMVLNTHSRIAMPHECNVVHTVLSAYPDAAAPVGDVERFARVVAGVRRFERVFGLTIDDVRRVCATSAVLTTEALLGRIYRAAKGVDPDDESIVWGDKFIQLGERVCELARYFPESRFVHLVRDARDSVTSIRQNFSAHRTSSGRFFATRSVVGAALLWRHMVEACDRDTGALAPDRTITVRYEDLVRDAESVARALCALAGLPFEPGMLDHDRRSSGRNAIPEDSVARYHPNVDKPLDTTQIGRGARDLAEGELAVVEAICGASMRRHGYVPTTNGEASSFAIRSRLFEYRVSSLLEDAGRRVARTLLPARSSRNEL